MASFSLSSKMLIYLAQEAQIALLVVKKIIAPAKYSNLTNVISKKSAVKLYEKTEINKHAINLKLDK